MLSEIINLIGIAITASFTSSGVVMYYIKKHDRISVIEKKFDMLSKGVELGLENDAVIFSALRNGHINGESERQEEKMREYFFHSSMRELYLSKGDEKNGKV